MIFNTGIVIFSQRATAISILGTAVAFNLGAVIQTVL